MNSRERVVLTYGDPSRGVPLLRVQRETLLERFPLASEGTERRRWQATSRAFVRHGTGCAVMVAAGCTTEAEDDPADRVEREESSASVIALLAHHLRSDRRAPRIGRRARLVCDGPRESRADRALRAALARRRVVTGTPLFLAC
jgi:hypothetical protein